MNLSGIYWLHLWCFNVHNSDENIDDFLVGFLKGVSLGLFDITMIDLADYL